MYSLCIKLRISTSIFANFRSAYQLWLMQAKHNASENVFRVSDIMLKACGGDGYKVIKININKLITNKPEEDLHVRKISFVVHDFFFLIEKIF